MRDRVLGVFIAVHFAVWAGLVLLVVPGPAAAYTLTATRPGVMCTGAAALAKLTRPDGSSRSAGADPRPEDLAWKKNGGCVDILPSTTTVDAVAVRRNTSIVLYDAHDGRGVRRFTVPNIDFAPGEASAAGPPPPHGPAWPDANYKPLVEAEKLLAAVRRTCPEQGWNERLLSHMEAGPWDSVTEQLTPAQHASMEKEISLQCEAGLSCPANITLGMEVRYGYFRSLMFAICSQRAPAEDGADP